MLMAFGGATLSRRSGNSRRDKVLRSMVLLVRRLRPPSSQVLPRPHQTPAHYFLGLRKPSIWRVPRKYWAPGTTLSSWIGRLASRSIMLVMKFHGVGYSSRTALDLHYSRRCSRGTR